jgi:O-succinylbenzoate synthase
VRIARIELFLVGLPLVRPFRTASGVEDRRQAILVRVETAEGVEGWGECVADAEPVYSPEFNDAAWTALERLFIPHLLESTATQPACSAEEVSPILSRWKGHRMAKGALELAVLDAELRSSGTSLQQYLGGSGDRVTPGVAVGITDTIDELLDLVASYRDEGYQRVKLKIAPGSDLGPVAATRELLGATYALQVDANAAYGRGDTEHLRRLDDFGLLLVEQPLDEDDLLGHALLAARLRTPVCLDESIRSAANARDAIALGACRIVNIKAGRVGGYLEAARVHDTCRAAKIPVWCGGMLETGIGRAANLALATMPGFELPGDISATSRYFHEDVTDPFVLEDGSIAVPSGPGLGVQIHQEVVERLSARRWSSA